MLKHSFLIFILYHYAGCSDTANKHNLPLKWDNLVSKRTQARYWIGQGHITLSNDSPCDILPSRIESYIDFSTLDAFGDVILASKECLSKAIELLLYSNVPLHLFGKFLRKRRHWLDESQWHRLFSLIASQDSERFMELYLCILNSFEYLEMVAPFFRPSLERVIADPLKSYVVRFTPLFFILGKVDIYVNKKGDRGMGDEGQVLYSEKLCQEFTSIMKVSGNDVIFLKALEAYLRASKYLRRALMDEVEYFNLNSWLRNNFLTNVQLEQSIIKNDYYRLAYLYYLPGISDHAIEAMLKNCAIGCLALFLARNGINLNDYRGSWCPGIQKLQRLTREISLIEAGRRQTEPCRYQDPSQGLERVIINLSLVLEFINQRQIKEASTVFYLILFRLFYIPFDYFVPEEIDECREINCLIKLANQKLYDYCASFGRSPTFSIQSYNQFMMESKERDESKSLMNAIFKWVTWPFELLTNSLDKNKGQEVSIRHSPGMSSSQSNDQPLPILGSLFERSARFSDSFEEQFMILASSAGLGHICTVNEDAPPPDYTLQSVCVPTNVDNWHSFTSSLPDTILPRYKMILPKKAKILALDLDETLVHSTSKSSGDCDYFVEVLIERSSCLYYVFKRPFVDRFLDTVASWYHLVIYTASLREYAEPVVNWLDRGRGLFKKRLYRTACLEQMGMFVKNLTLVDQDLSRVCLVDNSPASFLMHPDNGIPIESWTQDRTDTLLLDLLPFLDALRFVDDVRSILSLRRLPIIS